MEVRLVEIEVLVTEVELETDWVVERLWLVLLTEVELETDWVVLELRLWVVLRLTLELVEIVVEVETERLVVVLRLVEVLVVVPWS